MILRHLFKDAKTKSETENIRILEQIIERFRFFFWEKKKIKKQRFEINASRVRENNCLGNNFFHFQRNKVDFFFAGIDLGVLAEKKTFWCVKLVVLSVKTEQKIFFGGNFESRSFFFQEFALMLSSLVASFTWGIGWNRLLGSGSHLPSFSLKSAHTLLGPLFSHITESILLKSKQQTLRVKIFNHKKERYYWFRIEFRLDFQNKIFRTFFFDFYISTVRACSRFT